MNKFLAQSEYIDWMHPAVASQARILGEKCSSRLAIVQTCFEFVRDEIKHSYDFKLNPVTCKASDVLFHGTGYCYAKSHLLAALLRYHQIPTGLCYQRLSVRDTGAPFCLHGLNAVLLDDVGWYRVDARGNKPGIESRFTPPEERLAFQLDGKEERDLPEIWSEPLPNVIRVLTKSRTYEEVYQHLPDIELLPAARCSLNVDKKNINSI